MYYMFQELLLIVFIMLFIYFKNYCYLWYLLCIIYWIMVFIMYYIFQELLFIVFIMLLVLFIYFKNYCYL